MKRAALAGICLAALVATGWAGEKQYSNLKFTVVRADKGTPIRNASVVLHGVKKNGDQEKGGLQLKTNGDGEAVIDSIPYGKLRIQVIAPKFRTYGDDVEINQPEQSFTLKLEKPVPQVTIYK